MNYKEKFLKSINKIAEKEIDKVNINQHYLEVLESQDKEIERLNSIIKGLDNTIENLEEVVEHEDNIIKEVREYIKNNSYKTEWGDLEQDNEDININEDLSEKEFIEGLIEILDKENKND